jgi:hypothetical protein
MVGTNCSALLDEMSYSPYEASSVENVHYHFNWLISPIAIEHCIIYLQRKELCLFPEGLHQSRAFPHPLQRLSGIVAQLSEILGAEVR